MLKDINLCVYCCKKDNLKLLSKELLKGPQLKNKIPEISIIDYNSQTFFLIHICASYGSIECLNYLIDRGLDPSQVNNRKWNSLHFAARHGRIEVIKILHKYNVDVNAQTSEGYTPLMLASWFGYLDTVKYLQQECSADITIVDEHKCSALHRACQCNSSSVVEFLLECGHDPNIPNNEGYPLHISCASGDIESVRSLLRMVPKSMLHTRVAQPRTLQFKTTD